MHTTLLEVNFTPYVPTTVLGLLGLIFGYLYNAYRVRKNHQLEEIKSLPDGDRASVMEMRLNELGVKVDTTDMLSETKYALLVKMMAQKTNRYLIICITSVLFALILAFVIMPLGAKNNSQDMDKTKPVADTLKMRSELLNSALGSYKMYYNGIYEIGDGDISITRDDEHSIRIEAEFDFYDIAVPERRDDSVTVMGYHGWFKADSVVINAKDTWKKVPVSGKVVNMYSDHTKGNVTYRIKYITIDLTGREIKVAEITGPDHFSEFDKTIWRKGYNTN